MTLLDELQNMRRNDATSKALVFSLYPDCLKWLASKLGDHGFESRIVTGSMSLGARTKAIQAFQHDAPSTVFLLSTRVGAVGINLTAADHVFLLEPAVNQGLTLQAIGRAWRMGQTRPVYVKNLFVKDSVEEATMELARRMFSRVNKERTAVAVQSIGSIESEQVNLRSWPVEDIDFLFSM